jgi:hypothetical protein
MICGLQIFLNCVVLHTQISQEDGQGQTTTATADDQYGHFNGFHGSSCEMQNKSLSKNKAELNA